MYRLFVLLIMLLPFASAQADHKTLSVFVDDNYPPYMYGGSVSEVKGLYPLLLEKIISGTSLSADIKAVPWTRALLYGTSGLGL